MKLVPMPTHKVARLTVGANQDQIAEILRVHVNTVKRLEKKQPHELTIEEADAYAAVTGFTRAQVLGESPLPTQEAPSAS